MSQNFTNSKQIVVQDTAAKSAFGELRVTSLVPRAAWTFAYNIIDELVQTTLSGSGVVSQNAGRCKLESGASTNSSAKVATRKSIQYMPGAGALMRFTCVFDTPKAGNTQIIGLANGNDGLYFGYNGTAFGVCRKRAGVETWTTQANWNSNTCPWLTPQFGNVYQIDLQWLGYGAIRFYIEDINTGDFTLVHTIFYAGTSVDVSIMNPSLPIEMININTTNNTNITMYSPSAMAFQECPSIADYDNPLSVFRTVHTSKASVSTETPILLMKNDTTLSGITNRLIMDFSLTNLLTASNKTSHFRFIRNPTLGGTPPVYTNVLLNQSPALYDGTLTGVTYSAGTGIERFHASLNPSDRLTQDLHPIGLNLLPGETLLVTGMTAGTNGDMDVSLFWSVTF